MGKFVIDVNGLGRLAEAMAGVHLENGVKAGLENQILGAKLDKMRFEQDKAYRAQEARDNLLTGKIAALFPNTDARTRENLAYMAGGSKPVRGFRYAPDGSLMTGADGQPVLDNDYSLPESLLKSEGFAAKAGLLGDYANTARQIDAFGIDGAPAAKLWGGVEETARNRRLGDEILALARAGNTTGMNHLTAAREGKFYTPYKADGHGQIYSTDGAGGVVQTPVSEAKTAALDAQKVLYQGKFDTELRKQGLLERQQVTEGYKPPLLQAQTYQAYGAGAENYAQAEQARANAGLLGVKTQGQQQKNIADVVERGYMGMPDGRIVPVERPKGAVKFTPPTTAERNMFRETDTVTGQSVVNEKRLRQVENFARKNGFANVTDALPAFEKQERELARWTRGASDAEIRKANEAAQQRRQAAVTPYDRKGGVLGKPGTPRFGEQTAIYEQQAAKLGLKLQRGMSQAAAERTLKAMYERRLIPRDHLEVLFDYYTAAGKKK